jgi:hypothetical protein
VIRELAGKVVVDVDHCVAGDSVLMSVVKSSAGDGRQRATAIKYLRLAGADVHEKDANGQTPLDIAIEKGDVDAVGALCVPMEDLRDKEDDWGRASIGTVVEIDKALSSAIARGKMEFARSLLAHEQQRRGEERDAHITRHFESAARDGRLTDAKTWLQLSPDALPARLRTWASSQFPHWPEKLSKALDQQQWADAAELTDILPGKSWVPQLLRLPPDAQVEAVKGLVVAAARGESVAWGGSMYLQDIADNRDTLSFAQFDRLWKAVEELASQDDVGVALDYDRGKLVCRPAPRPIEKDWSLFCFQVLGLWPDAVSEEDLDAAFRKWSLSHHPDRNSDPEMQAIFKKVSDSRDLGKQKWAKTRRTTLLIEHSGQAS